MKKLLAFFILLPLLAPAGNFVVQNNSCYDIVVNNLYEVEGGSYSDLIQEGYVGNFGTVASASSVVRNDGWGGHGAFHDIQLNYSWVVPGLGVQYSSIYRAGAYNSGDGYTFTIEGTCDGICRTNLIYHIVNQDSVSHDYSIQPFGIPSCGNSVFDLPPGGKANLTQTVRCDDISKFGLFQIGHMSGSQSGLSPNPGGGQLGLVCFYGGDNFDGKWINSTPDGSSAGGFQGTIGDTNTLPSMPTVGTGTGSDPSATLGIPGTNILWSAGSSVPDLSGVISAIKDAASVAHDDAVKIGTQAHDDLTGATNVLGSGIRALLSSLTNGYSVGFGTNIISGSTNIFSLTNYATEGTLHGISNLLASMSNSVPFTNGLTAQQVTNLVASYQDLLSNGLTSTFANQFSHTSAATIFGASTFVSQIQGLGGGGVPSLESGPGEQEFQIDLGHEVVIKMGKNMPNFFHIREVIVWALIVGLVFFNWKTFYTCLSDSFKANQTTTAGSSLFGNNINAVSAEAAAVIIVAVISGIPAVAVAILSGETSLFVGTDISTIMQHGGGFGWSFLNNYIPFLTLLTCVISRLVFTTLIQSIALVVMGIKAFIVGL